MGKVDTKDVEIKLVVELISYGYGMIASTQNT